MEKQFNLMQSQIQMLISTLGNSNKNEIEKNSIAKNLYESGFIKEGTLQQRQDDNNNKKRGEGEGETEVGVQENEKKETTRLIHEAGKAAYQATTRNSVLTKKKKEARAKSRIRMTSPTTTAVMVK